MNYETMSLKDFGGSLVWGLDYIVTVRRFRVLSLYEAVANLRDKSDARAVRRSSGESVIHVRSGGGQCEFSM